MFQALRIKGIAAIGGVAAAMVLSVFSASAQAQHMDAKRDIALAHDVFFAARIRQDPVLYASAARLLAPHFGETSVLIEWIKAELGGFPAEQIPDLRMPGTARKGVKGDSIVKLSVTLPGDGVFTKRVEMEPMTGGLAFIVLEQIEDTEHLEVQFSGDWGHVICPSDSLRPGGYRCEWDHRRVSTTVITITNTAPFDIQAFLTIQ